MAELWKKSFKTITTINKQMEKIKVEQLGPPTEKDVSEMRKIFKEYYEITKNNGSKLNECRTRMMSSRSTLNTIKKKDIDVKEKNNLKEETEEISIRIE